MARQTLRIRQAIINYSTAGDAVRHTMRLVRGSTTRYVWLDEDGRDTHVTGDTLRSAEMAALRAWPE